MANTGNTQQIIDYGTTANDGTGDPLRTAFIKTDENFDNVWLAGPVGSNITIANNIIQSNNTNGNIVLKPNGVGVIQANAAIMPSAANVRDIGSTDLPFRAGYFGLGGVSVNGNVTVTGNLTAGNIKYTGNVFVGDLQGSVFADDSTLMVDAVNNIIYADEMIASGRISATGNVIGDYIKGNGSFLTGVTSSYGNANVAAYLPTYTGNLNAGNIFVANNATVVNNFYNKTGTFTGDAAGDNSIYAGFPTFTVLGSDVIAQFSGNTDAYIQFNFQNGNAGNQSSGDYVITADNGNDTTHFLNIGLTGGNWDGTQPNSLNSRLGPNDGYFYVQDGNLAIGVKNGSSTDYIWRFDITGNVTSDGNLIPSANLTYSLGNSTNWWSNIWVASNTIYIGGVALGVTGNTLTVAGEPVLSNDSESNIATTGTITAGNIITNGISSDDSTFVTVQDGLNVAGDIESSGNITADYFFGNGSQLTGVASTGNITFSDTTMSPPDGEDIIISAANSQVDIQALDFRVETTDDVRITGNGTFSLRNLSTTEPISIFTDYDGSAYGWEFNADGSLTTPGDITVSGDVTGTSGASTLVLRAQPASNTAIQLNDSVDSVISTVANLEIRTDVSNTAKTWEFDTTGSLTAPGAISATGNISGGNIITTGNVSGNTAGYAIGYRDIPQVSFTGNATIATTDAGKHFYSTQSTDYILTIANNASQGFQVGAAITIVNQGTGNITIAQDSGVTLYLAGNASSGNRSVATFGMATIMKVATDTWFINGTGVS